MNTYDLSPLFRSTIGYDRLSQLIDNAFKADERAVAYPPYNIIKLSNNEYKIVMAVAGFGLEDLNIITQENALVVSGNMQAKEPEGATYLHRGIAQRGFERKFSLADHVKVQGAHLADGLLTLTLKREIPEESKPRMIPIEVSNAALSIENTTKNGKKS